MLGKALFRRPVGRIKRLSIALAFGAGLLCPRVGRSAETVAVEVLVVDSADEAAGILLQLQGGADFAELAREKSTDATSVDGGFLGRVDPATLRPELRNALQGLRPGELSRVVKLPSGYALLKVLPESEGASLDEINKTRQAAIAAAGSVRYVPDLDGEQEA